MDFMPRGQLRVVQASMRTPGGVEDCRQTSSPQQRYHDIRQASSQKTAVSSSPQDRRASGMLPPGGHKGVGHHDHTVMSEDDVHMAKASLQSWAALSPWLRYEQRNNRVLQAHSCRMQRARLKDSWDQWSQR